MNKNTNLHIAALLATVTSGVALSYGQPASEPASEPASQPSASATPNASASNTASLLDWKTQPWSASDTSYRTAKASVTKSIFSGQSLGQARQAYTKLEQAARKEPQNTLAQWSWAYATYQAAITNPLIANSRLEEADSMTGEIILQEPLQALRRLNVGDSYQFVRMRFLLEALAFDTDDTARDALVPVTRRLLTRNPNDDEVIHQTLRVLDPAKPAERQRALIYLRTLLRSDPKSLRVQSAQAATHFSFFLATKSKAEKALAIAGYQKYLSLAPKNDPFRSQAEGLIKLLRTL